jgi:microcystin-dependent protein
MGTGPDGTTYQIGETAGTESETITQQQTPIHTHSLIGSTNIAQNPQPNNAVLAQGPAIQAYITGSGEIAMSQNSITPVGGSQPHDNMQPFLCINFIISLFGIFPSQT